MKIDLPPLSEQQQDRLKTKRDKFFTQTVKENNQRLNNNVDTFAKLLAEVKFIESVLLTKL